MITKTPIVTNYKEIEKAQSMALADTPDEELEYVEFGFRINDVMYYKIVGTEIELTFRNGREEVINYSDSAASRLKQIFKES